MHVSAKRNLNAIPRKTIGGLTGKFRKSAEIYRIFASSWEHVVDLSDAAMINMFNHESIGEPLTPNNGFAIGKSYMNLHVTMWREDLAKGYLFKWELYSDERFPHEWLDSVLGNHSEVSEILQAKPKTP